MMLVSSTVVLALISTKFADAQTRMFSIPSEDAAKSLPEFARQANLQLMVPIEQFNGVRTSAVIGREDVHVALARLTAGTGLQVGSDGGRVIALREQPLAPPSKAPTQPASAASPAPAVSEIVVTAQKRSERINDVPISITAATGSQLQKLGITDPVGLQKIVAGFTFQQSNYGVPILGIRGVNFYDTSATSNPAVSVYVDQIPIPFSALTKDASLDVSRVEVLKGPQGTLFGENSTGGAINYIAAKPTDTLHYGGDVSYGRFNAVDVDGYLSGPLTDTLKARVAIRTDQQDNWQYSTSRDATAGQHDLNMGRLILDWTPRSNLRVELNLNGYVDHSDTQQAQFLSYLPTTPGSEGGRASAGAALSGLPSTPRNARAADWTPGIALAQDDNFIQSSLRADWDLKPDLTLTSISSYINYTGSQPTDASGTSYDDLNVDQRQKFDVYIQELRLAGRSGPLRWLGGVNYEHDNLNEADIIATMGSNTQIGALNFSNLTASNFQKVDTKAFFGSLDYKLTDTINLSGSARFTGQHRAFEGCESGAGDTTAEQDAIYATLGQLSATPLVPGSCISFNTGPSPPYTPAGQVHSSINQNNVSWRAGADWKILPRTLVYFNVSKGYKAGDFSTQPIVFASQVVSVQQESLVAYELGFKSTLDHGRLQVDGAGFYYDYDNKQIDGFVTIPIFGNFPALVNVPRSDIKGGELNVSWNPLPPLHLTANGTYISSEVDSHYIGGTPIPGLSVDFHGESLPNTPKWQLNGDAEYDVPLSDRLNGFVGATVTYRSSAFAVFGETAGFNIPAYALLDLRAGVQDKSERWRVQAYARNVTNSYYLTNIDHEIDTISRYTGLPVTYGVRLSFNY